MAFILKRGQVKRCKICGLESPLISSHLGVCLNCIRENPGEALEIALNIHKSSRSYYGLPPEPPRSSVGVRCNLCANQCSIGEGETGFCGLRWVKNGRLESYVSSETSLLHYYLDPHVTNCCSAWFCPAGTGAGYPKYAYTRGPEYGYYNLALFFYGCNFDCLFCQNYSHKRVEDAPVVTVSQLVDETLANQRISCWCFFGGSPEPQLPFAVRASEEVLKELKPGRILRICFEWNGCGNKALVKKAGELSLRSGGNIKFDLKAYSDSLNKALSGVSNRRAYENFEMLFHEFYTERPGLPVLTATTLLVPGYVDSQEVEGIARFLADLDPEIPYSLLIFHPDYMMRDLPITPVNQVVECYKAARRYLKNVNVGNLHLIGFSSMDGFKKSFGLL